MGKQQDASILKSGNVRAFIQENGVSPAAPYVYYGCTMLGNPNQDLGTPEPVYCPSPDQRGKWDIIDDIPKTPSLGTTDFTQHASKTLTEIWMELKDRGCKFNLQMVAGTCQKPDNFQTLDAKIIFTGTRLTNLGLSDLNVLNGDDNAVVDYTGSLSFQNWYLYRPIRFGERADSTVVADVLDGFYYDTRQCGECGTPSDGCNKAYVLTQANSGSPGLSGQIVYSLDKGLTWASVDISTLGGLSANRIAAMGDKLVVVSQATGSHHYSPFTSVDAGSVNWTAVSTDYVASKGPRAIDVRSSSQAFIAAAGGYIYVLANPTAGVSVLTDGSLTTQDLNDIHHFGDTIVAVGGNNAVLASSNGGNSFSLITGPAVGINLTAIWCFSNNTWFVGTGNGRLYYTLNGGTTWTQVSFAAGVSVINDIRFEDEVIGYMSVEQGGAGKVYRTSDSGNTWQTDNISHIHSLPTAVRYNFVWPCGPNRVLTGGRKTVGGDGVVAIAE